MSAPAGGPAEPIVITGPTASGKGAVAFELARRLGGEIVSMDSMKVYRELDVATAKPPAECRSDVRYHLIDILDPGADFSTGEYLPLLVRTIEEITSRSRPVIIAGGTALYLKAYVDGFQSGPAADWALRGRLLEEGRALGASVLHERLQAVDPMAAAKIHVMDLRRIVRALEVLETTGRPISAAWGWSRPAGPKRPWIFGLEWTRDALHARIDRRVERMVERGLFEEALRLQTREPPPSRSAAQAIGYKEIWEAAEGERREDIILSIQRRTRRFAKSQLTWFRKLPVAWLPQSGMPEPGAAAEEILRRLREAGRSQDRLLE
ncbi:MAG TPA: tRNA (adenosine(37)-N6)-dimethylallyltransferase MiaA [Planctomycetota bacterium]|nr:tRNA (adenosine(37)-N6)-dimethylallyltransferase MiaA [Planctomycetota bacterium]